MSLFFLVLCFTLVLAQLVMPRRVAFVPLLIAICHCPNVPVLVIGVTFSITKLLILAAMLRAACDRRRVWSTQQPLDLLIAAWACWAVLSGFAHHPRDHDPITLRLSLVFDTLGAYLYARYLLRGPEDMLRFAKWLALVLIPLAVLMTWEVQSGKNVYSAFGAPQTEVRSGHLRANGPFSHAILAGTVGGACLPLILPLLRLSPWLTVAGVAACATIAAASNSSGPLMTFGASLVGLGLWRWRSRLPWIRTTVLVGLIGLHFVMKAPVWYLIARIDLTGSSTSYYRAELITQALNHIDEWWMTGTDYTRHWMATGVLWSADQVDLTNSYIRLGVTGGLPLLLLLVAILAKAFQSLGRRMRLMRLAQESHEYVLWCVGVTLFAYTTTFVSVTLFDQSYALFCLMVGAVAGLASSPVLPKSISDRCGDAQFLLRSVREIQEPIRYGREVARTHSLSSGPHRSFFQERTR